jgi:hypothetical protein
VSGRSRLLLALVAYGVLLGALSVVRWDGEVPTASVRLIDTRQAGIATSLAVLEQGGPPLVAARGPYRAAVADHSTVAADFSDDTGVYLYLPVAGELLGQHDPRTLFKWFSLLLLSLVVVSYPLTMFLLFDSVVVALLVPLLLVLDSGFFLNDDIYFIQAWAVLLLLPVVLLVLKARWRRRASLGALVTVAVGASFASSVRSTAGAGVALAAAIVAVAREQGWRRRTGGAALVAGGYLLVTPVAVDAVKAYSFRVAHVPSAAQSGGHPLWHNVYIGLGVLPNPWGIQWSDSSGAAAVARVDPTAAYLSPRYERIARDLYFDAVQAHPGAAARLYAIKAAFVFQHAWSHLWPGLLLLPLVLLAGRRRRQFRLEAALVLPSLLLGLAPPVLATPSAYDSGFLAAAALLALFGLIGTYLIVRDRVVGWKPLAIAGAAAVAVAALGLVSDRVETRNATDLSNQLESSVLVDPPKLARVLQVWKPPALAGWEDPGGASLSLLPGKAVYLTSAPSAGMIELISPPLRLAAGSYALVADGLVTRGGLQLGTWDPQTRSWSAESRYWSKQVGFESRRMLVAFSLPRPRTLRIALGAWGDQPVAPAWVLRSVALGRSAG